MAEDKMVRKHHPLNRHEFHQTLGDSRRQGSLMQSMGFQRVGHCLTTEQQGYYIKIHK